MVSVDSHQPANDLGCDATVLLRLYSNYYNNKKKIREQGGLECFRPSHIWVAETAVGADAAPIPEGAPGKSPEELVEATGATIKVYE
jgi:hypothetical protein